MSNRAAKFENPDRLAELSPAQTLRKTGLSDNTVLCDIGAGSGVFTIPAAHMTKNTVYALDIDTEMLRIISEKAKTEGLDNIVTLQVTGSKFDLPDGCADMAILVTVLHEIEDKAVFLSEIKRILNSRGRLIVIEFHQRQTPMGPPLPQRLDSAEVTDLLVRCGFRRDDLFDMGVNFYCAVFSV